MAERLICSHCHIPEIFQFSQLFNFFLLFLGTSLCVIIWMKLPKEGGDGVLHLLRNRGADCEAEVEGEQVDVGAQLVAQTANLGQSHYEQTVDMCTFETVITGREGQSDV